MKKIVALILALLLPVLCCACSNGTSDVGGSGSDVSGSASLSDDNSQKELDLGTVYQAIIDAQAETGLEELIVFEEFDTGYLSGFYPGIDQYEMLQSHFYLPPVYGHACEIVLLELANEADIPAVKDILQNRIDVASDDSSYPENAGAWAQYAQIQQQGNYLCLIVLPEGYVIPENVFNIQ